MGSDPKVSTGRNSFSDGYLTSQVRMTVHYPMIYEKGCTCQTKFESGSSSIISPVGGGNRVSLNSPSLSSLPTGVGIQGSTDNQEPLDN